MSKIKLPTNVIKKVTKSGTYLYWVAPKKDVYQGFKAKSCRLPDDKFSMNKMAHELNLELEEFRNQDTFCLVGDVLTKNPTFQNVIDWFKTTAEFTTSIEEKTRKDYIYSLNRFLDTQVPWRNNNTISEIRVTSFVPGEALRMKNLLLQNCLSGSGEIQTNRILAIANRALNLAEDFDVIESNPFKKVKNFRENTRSRFDESTIFTKDDIDKLVYCSDNNGYHELSLAILLANHLCQRMGDVVNSIKKSSIKNNFDTIEFIQNKTKKHDTHPRIFPLKTPGGKEIFPDLLPRIKEMFYLHNLDTLIAYKSKHSGEYIKYNTDLVRKHFHKVRKIAGVSEAKKFMHFRSSGLTAMAKCGCDQQMLLNYSGHKSIKMLDRYVKSDTSQTILGAMKRFHPERLNDEV